MSFVALVNAFNANPCEETFRPIVKRISDQTPREKGPSHNAVADLRAIAFGGFGDNASRDFVFPFVIKLWHAERPTLVANTAQRAKARATAAISKYA
jgi:hypothetical protein